MPTSTDTLAATTAVATADQAVRPSLRFLDALFPGQSLQRVSFALWEGTLWPDATPRAATLRLNHLAALRRMFEPGTELGLAEAYLHDDFDIEGEFEASFELADALTAKRGWLRMLSLANQLRGLPTAPDAPDVGAAPNRSFFSRQKEKHSLRRDREAVSFHYDVSNEFYRLWLDRQMVYSCAYFQHEEQSLDDAQVAKFSHICKKLRLRSGQRLLDIGCGWGGLAVYAARNYGVSVVGVTLSERQHAEGVALAAHHGLSDRVDLRLLDYRELRESEGFDAIVSVGMAEHVGLEELPRYFQAAEKLLKPGGLFLNHAIGEGPRYRPAQGPSFIDEYVFPDADLPPIRTIARDAEAAGFEVRDVENLREHYAMTLRHWVRNLTARHDEALAFVNEPTYRVWKLYMAGSAHAFEYGGIAVYQTLLAKLSADGRAGLPLTRNDWYR